jgi:ABC-2 type transport system ATP-binding protein
MLYVKHLCYEYFDKAALSDVSFTLRPQTITALIGPNGAGKTTLLRCLAALQSPSAGEVILDGTNVHEHPRQIHKNSAIWLMILVCIPI